jgi:DNA-binding CsgD family transcriptional regulator
LIVEDTYDYALKRDPLAETIAKEVFDYGTSVDWGRGHDPFYAYQLEQIIAGVLSKSDAVYIRLTPREAEITRRILDGAGIKQLAKDHGITMKRVQAIYKKVARKIRWYQERYRARIAAQSKAE